MEGYDGTWCRSGYAGRADLMRAGSPTTLTSLGHGLLLLVLPIVVQQIYIGCTSYISTCGQESSLFVTLDQRSGLGSLTTLDGDRTDPARIAALSIPSCLACGSDVRTTISKPRVRGPNSIIPPIAVFIPMSMPSDRFSLHIRHPTTDNESAVNQLLLSYTSSIRGDPGSDGTGKKG